MQTAPEHKRSFVVPPQDDGIVGGVYISLGLDYPPVFLYNLRQAFPASAGTTFTRDE